MNPIKKQQKKKLKNNFIGFLYIIIYSTLCYIYINLKNHHNQKNKHSIQHN